MAPHVLIVDDDSLTRESLSHTLRAEGYAVTEAGDGAAALACLHSGPPMPQLVILDLMMPIMDGWQFLVERQKLRAEASVPVLVVTASRGVDAPGLRALGAEDVIEKPAEPEVVLAAVRCYCPSK
jgi:DNA-binding response OmpR family regulator